jgi:PGF-CTERM protein
MPRRKYDACGKEAVLKLFMRMKNFRKRSNGGEMKEKALIALTMICLVLGAVLVGCVNGIVSAGQGDTEDKKILELAYDDGSSEFGFVGSPGTVGATKFTVSSMVHILKLKFHISGAMKPVRIHVLDANFNSIFSREVTPSLGWYEVDISDANLFERGDFFVGWQWISECPDGPWIDVDKTPAHHQRSYLGSPGQEPTPALPDEDYLIRAIVYSAEETASKLINSVPTKIDALKRKNVDTSVIEQALSKAKDSYELEKYDEACELVENAHKMADNAYETAEHIESAQSEIDEAKSIGADVTEAESKLKDAKDALNKGNYEYARLWADDALELAKHASIGSVKIIDLKALATKYDQRTVVVSGTIRDIKTVYGKGYTFALDDGSGMISVVYEGGLGDIQEGDKVTVSGIFQASTGTVAADTVHKSGVGGVPGFEAIFVIAGLMAVAYLIRRRKEG